MHRAYDPASDTAKAFPCAISENRKMDFIQFQNPGNIHWIWLVASLVILMGVLLWHRRDRLNAFISPEMQKRLLTQASATRRVVQLVFVTIAGILCVFALMRPQIVTTQTVHAAKTSANIYVLLDVSKSMLATDVVPTRLDRAKSEIRDMMRDFSAHNLGLMAFAGRATVLSPLTTDHGFFRLVLDTASPSSVSMGGTNIGEAIEKATKMLAPQEGPKAILLISDGEAHDAYPVEAAKEAKKAGIVIVSVGFGSETGTTLDILDKKTGQKKRILDAANHEVISRLNGAMLRDIALATDGAYVPASNQGLDLEDIMRRSILPLVEDINEVNTREVRVELFQWFVAGALLFLAGFMLLESNWRRRRNVGDGGMV